MSSRFIFCIVLTYALVLTALCDPIALVRVGDPWKFIPAAEANPQPEPLVGIPPWVADVKHDTTRWSNGISGFTTGSPRFTLVTMVPSTNGTLRLRNVFTVDDVTQIKFLTLRTECLHGFIVWINGVEAARVNVPTSAGLHPTVSQLITNRYSGHIEEFDLSSKISLLKSGTNLLAIQYHAGNPQSPSVYFVPELFANFSRAPVLMNMSSNQVLLHWKTVLPTVGIVDVFKEDKLLVQVPSESQGTNHYASITNLVPGNFYQYRVRNQSGVAVATSPTYTFRTFAASNTPIHFSVVGDTGYGYLPQMLIAKQLKTLGGDCVIHLGDLVYPYLTDDTQDLRIFSIYGTFNHSIPFAYTPGNHDSYNGGRAVYRNLFRPSTRGTDGIGLFSSFDHGPVHFVQLDTDTLAFARYEPGSQQYQWLENDLATTTKPWKVIFTHHVLRSSSVHQYDDYNSDGISDLTAMQQSVGLLAAKYGVQLVLTSHDHNYERFSPIDGVVTVVSGGGGASLYGMQKRYPGSSQFWPIYHCLDVHVDENKLKARALDSAGNVFDEFTIHRVPPVPRNYASTWATPEFPTIGATDSDGNITGQQFTLKGEVLPTALGRFSGLGDAYINNDERFIYIGFARAMLQHEQSIFVFLQNAKIAGVPTLIGLGNGLIDPMVQGVDGLDFLENLGFTNFSPTIGCVFGNEVADAQARNFVRSSSLFQPGQGAFFLDGTFSNVLGIKLQQFNRSPQMIYERDEENADFIKLALPMESLGLKPGEVLRIGAVIGLPYTRTNITSQTRPIDSAYFGSGLWRQGVEDVLLAPLSITLASDPARPQGLNLQILVLPDDKLELSWSAEPNLVYNLQFTDSLAMDFVDHPSATRLTAPELRQIKYAELPVTKTRYYRVVKLP